MIIFDKNISIKSVLSTWMLKKSTQWKSESKTSLKFNILNLFDLDYFLLVLSIRKSLFFRNLFNDILDFLQIEDYRLKT